MNFDSLLNLSVQINISDPWELGEKIHWQPLHGVIDATLESENKILICLVDAIEFKQCQCKYFIASLRYQGTCFQSIAKGEEVMCGFTRISTEQALSNQKFDLSSWRGGIALIGSLTLNCGSHD